MKVNLLTLFIIFICTSLSAQVKIGDNPSSINPISILELESSDKVLVITRLSTAQINALPAIPMEGAMVFNTDTKCIHVYTNSNWKNLCDSKINVTTSSTAPTNNGVGDVWVDDSNYNLVSIWDGSVWIPVNANPKRGNGPPNNTTAPSPTAGDIYVDINNGKLYTYDGTNWIDNSSLANANNGLSVNSGTIQLGGRLITPTVITTDNANTLAIEGLQNGNTTTDDIVTIDQTTGVLKRVPLSSITTPPPPPLREEVTKIIASNGQLDFNVTLFTTDKINVFRNGARIDFTIIGTNIIRLEPDAICYDGDEIRIVQLY